MTRTEKIRQSLFVILVAMLAASVTFGIQTWVQLNEINDRSEQRSKSAFVHIKIFNSQPTDHTDVSVLLRNERHESMSFSDFRLSVRDCDSRNWIDYPTYRIGLGPIDPTQLPKPINLPENNQQLVELRFFTPTSTTQGQRLGCGIRLFWVDQDNTLRQTSQLEFDAPVPFFRSSGVGG